MSDIRRQSELSQEEILEGAIERLATGESLDAILASSSADADWLEPLLTTATDVRGLRQTVAVPPAESSLAAFLAQYELSRVGFLLAINVLFLILGCILESGAILLIIVPIFIPTAQALGIDLVHFGVICVVNAMLGLITPPYGLLLFIVSSITREPLGRIIRDLWPFLLALITALMIITFVPDFVLWLPRWLGYKG